MGAFGVGQWPPGSAGAFGDWTPLLLVLVSLLLIRFLIRLPLNWPTTLLAIGLGTVWGSLTEIEGVLRPAAVVFVLVLAASWAADRLRKQPS